MIKKLLLGLALLLLPGVAEAVDRYVSTTGATTNCTTMQTIGTPGSSINAGLACLAPGDTLYIRGGTYNERLLIYNIGSMQAGTNFTTGAITISGYPGETVVVKPTTVQTTPVIDYSDGTTTKDWYHIWQNLTVDGTATGPASAINSVTNSTQHVRFQDMIVQNTGGNSPGSSGSGFSWTGNFSEFLRIESHHNGIFNDGVYNQACGYGYYVGGGFNLIEGGSIHHNGGYGLHGYHFGGGALGNNIVRNVTIYDNGSCANQETSALLMWTDGGNNQIYNNVIYMTQALNPAGQKGISIAGAPSVAYNNTVYNFNYPGLSIVNAPGTTMKNNIVYQTDTSGAFGTQIEVFNSAGSTITPNFLTNPSFVNTATANFRLQSGSPALNIGEALGAPYNVDISGTTRPQGTGYDMGAFELAATPTCPSLPNALVAQYRFEGVATDSSGNGLTATLGTGVTYTTGKYGQGALMPGTAGITVNDNDLLDLCASFALEAWVSVPSLATDVMFVVKNPDSKYFLGTLNGYCDPAESLVGGYSQGAANALACTAPLLVPGTFTHLAVSYDGTTVSLYRNGSLVTTTAGGATLDATTGTLQFCTSGFNEHCAAGTIIDEVKIYRGPRTAPQILADMMDGATPAQVVLKIPAGATGLKLGGSGVKLGAQSQ